MLRLLTAFALLLPIVASGCSYIWQANKSSEAVDISPFNWGSGQSVFSPANSFGYSNGEAMDARTRR
jgi:hypothetical protein